MAICNIFVLLTSFAGIIIFARERNLFFGMLSSGIFNYYLATIIYTITRG